MTTSIVNNANAVNAQRNLSITSMKMGKVLEKLSSGYRINRAADDAAGLGISEKMRAQIRGNSQAIRNANDGISMIQTAEGAMDEVHSILQRMRELGVQAANDTNDTAARDSIAIEINQLRTEIDRIANATQFNGQSLLTGALSSATGATVSGGTLATGQQVAESVVAGTAATDLVAGDIAGSGGNTVTVATITLNNEAARSINPATLTFTYDDANNNITLAGTGFTATRSANDWVDGNIDFTDASTGAQVRLAVTLAGTAIGANEAAGDTIGAALTAAADDTIVLVNDAANSASVSAITTTGTTAPGTYTISRQGTTGETLRVSNGTTNIDYDLATLFAAELPAATTSTLNFAAFGLSLAINNASAGAVDTQSLSRDLNGLTITVAAGTGTGDAAILQVGANVTTNDEMAISFNDTRASTGSGLSLIDQTVTAGQASALDADVVVSFATVTGTGGIVGSNDRAQALIHLVDNAITTLNTRRANLGASQNRLESTVNSLGVAVENLTASESRIRDADIAKLSSEMVSKQILQQAGVAMLSQANQMSQSVLSLLR